MHQTEWVVTATNSSMAYLGIYGWRKRCLYFMLLGLLCLLVVNFVLTLWLMKVMKFSLEGIGELRILPGGVQLPGHAHLLGSLLCSSIFSRLGRHLTIESAQNLTIATRNADGRVNNVLYIDDSKVTTQGQQFAVNDLQGRNLLSIDKEKTIFGVDSLRVTNNEGAFFDGSIQTPLLENISGKDLKLESPTRRLQIFGPEGVSIESRAGDLNITSLTDFKLHSNDGVIHLSASNVYLPALRTFRQHHGHSSVRRNSRHKPSKIYQLCACNDGKLFLAPSEGRCDTESHSGVCR